MLDNAGKFSPRDGTVGVTLTSDGMLTVADQGPGVPSEALPHVFDRFYRADEARALPGSGLGLAIAQQVAEGHGGRITLGNGRDGGTVATLMLPVVAEEPTGQAAAVRDAGGDTAADPDPAAGADEPGVPMPVEESLFR
jgi:signal transduction histidine kinase